MPMYGVLDVKVISNGHLQHIALIRHDQGSRLLVVDQVHLAGESIWTLVVCSCRHDSRAVRSNATCAYRAP